MDFDLNEDQRLLKESLSRLLANTYGGEARKAAIASAPGWSRAQWARFAEMGLLALPFAEQDGGIGGGAVETMLVMEQLGAALSLEPYLATVVLGGGLLQSGGTPEQRAALLPGIADGSLTLAFAQAEAQSRFDLHDVATTARADGDGWIIEGEKRHVVHGDTADRLIVSARVSGSQRDHAGIGLFLVAADAPGVTIRGYTTQDRQRAAQVRFDSVQVGRDAAIGAPDKALPLIEAVADKAIAALCAETVGLCDAAFAMTLDYVKTREQFGRAIGQFQAIQHRIVDMLMQLEEARSMAMYATMMCEDADPEERCRAVSMAKIKVCEAGRFVTEQAIQLHGGIGMTDEHAIGHYYRRMTVIELQFGSRDHHLERLIRPGLFTEERA